MWLVLMYLPVSLLTFVSVRYELRPQKSKALKSVARSSEWACFKFYHLVSITLIVEGIAFGGAKILFCSILIGLIL